MIARGQERAFDGFGVWAYPHLVSGIRNNTGDRAAALVATATLCVVLLASMGVFAEEAYSSDDPCLDCSGCETGECDSQDGDCCRMCCMAQAPLTLATLMGTLSPAVAEAKPLRTTVVAVGRSPETPYRPPRS